MKTIRSGIVVFFISLGLIPFAYGQGTAFTYQGRLNNNGSPVTGNYDLAFKLFTTNSGGSAIAGPVTNTTVGVTNGLFTTTIDFGNAFTGTSNWIEIAVSPSGSNTFTTLAPRQQVTPTPYASYAANAAIAASANSVANGSVGTSAIADHSISASKFANGNAVTSLNSLTGGITLVAGGNVTISGHEDPSNQSGSITIDTTFDPTLSWLVGGNGVVSTSPVIGPTNALSLDLVMQSSFGSAQRVVHWDSSGVSGNQGATIVAGWYGNYAAPNCFGAVIAGGGYLNASNEVHFPYATVSGGAANNASGPDSDIAGGFGNYVTLQGQYGAIGGGFSNVVNFENATIGGGQLNTNAAESSTIGGGNRNYIFSQYSTIAGGSANQSGPSGGLFGYNSIGGGANNVANGLENTVSGGFQNVAAGTNSTVSGGTGNTASNTWATVAGGLGNRATGSGSFVAGGGQNIASGAMSFAAGNNAGAINDNSFVWNSESTGITSTVPREVLFNCDQFVINPFPPGIGSTNTNAGVNFHAFTGAEFLFDVYARKFIGDGSQLTGITVSTTGFATNAGNASTLGGVPPGSYAVLSNFNIFTANNVFSNGLTSPGLTVMTNVNNFINGNFTGNFTGNGSQLTQLNPSSLSSSLGASQLPANIVYNNSSGNTLSGTFNGTHNGNGGGLTNLNASQLASGTVPQNVLAGFQSPNFAEVGGGASNSATGQYSDIGGGQFNQVTATLATIGGGYQNTNIGLADTIAGGQQNVVSGNSATVSGGTGNTATNDYAAVAGGLGNHASGAGAFIAGGELNVASGANSFAGGLQARATNDGSFVWNGLNSPMSSSNSHEVIFNCSTFTIVQNAVLNWTNLAGLRVGTGIQAMGNIWANQYFGDGSQLTGIVANNAQNAQTANFATTAGDASTVGGISPSAFAQVAASNTFTGSNVFIGQLRASGVAALTNANDQFAGTFTGNGANLTNLNASQLATGLVPQNVLPSFQAPNYFTIGGGQLNIATGFWDTVAGGDNNSNMCGSAGAIAGGQNNLASGSFQSAVGGGFGNQAWESYSVIGGGLKNYVTTGATHATIAGGADNTQLSGAGNAFIGGGAFNTNGSFRGVIGGGFSNYVGTNSESAAILGGENDTIVDNANNAFIGGGSNNTVTGFFGTIPGGANNLATNFAFAAGNNAQAVNTGAFVWNDSTSTTTTSFTNNQFMARASGGVIFLSGTAASPTSYNTGSAGVALQPGATAWATVSDQNAKKNFASVNGEEVLEKLASVPVEKWNYKWEGDDSTPNIGPMAQAFKAAFYPGRDDKSITTLEFDGVELAAIQGLNQKLEEQKTENAELKRQLAELKAMVQKIAEQK